MECTKCGAVADDGAQYCGQCGTKLDRAGGSSWLPPGASKPTGKIIGEPPAAISKPSPEPAPKSVVVSGNSRTNDRIAGWIGGGCVLAIILIPLYLVLSWCSGPTKTPEETKAEQARTLEDQRKGFHCLSAWDGSNRSFVEQVKKQLRDPDSFEMVETRIAPVQNGQHLITMEYRARNGFGGMNVAIATGSVDHATCDATVTSLGE